MRTTVRLEDALMAELKRFAAERGQTVTAVIDEALREKIHRREHTPPSDPVSLTTVGGSGLQAGIDLDDTATLLEVMEENDPAS